MINWKKVKQLIINLDCILCEEFLSKENRLNPNIEKFLFYLLEVNSKIKLMLVSDLGADELTKNVKKFGLDFFFKHITSSQSMRVSLNKTEFWHKYFVKYQLTATKIILIDKNISIAQNALKLGIQQAILITNNEDEQKNTISNILYTSNIINLCLNASKPSLKETTCLIN